MTLTLPNRSRSVRIKLPEKCALMISEECKRRIGATAKSSAYLVILDGELCTSCAECRAAFVERRDRPSTASSGKAASY